MDRAALQSLVGVLQKQVPMLVRRAPPTGDSLEGVLSGQDLPRCCEVLTAALGPPVKDFGKTANLEGALQWAVKGIGGIRTEQCLYLKEGEQQQIVYAVLWPWASDSSRVTLKVGIAGQ